MAAETTSTAAAVRHRPKSYTVFAAAFIAGAAAAVGVNRVLDVQLAQRRPQVECEPIFVALRPLSQGAPVTVWDVALKDWPKAMLPSSALRAGDTFEGCVLRHAVREGQPLLAVQLVKSGVAAASSVATEAFTPAVPAAPSSVASPAPQSDPWMPAESIDQSIATPTTPTEPSRAATGHAVASEATPQTVATTRDATEPPAVATVQEPTPLEPQVPQQPPAQPVAETSTPTAAAAPTLAAPPRPMPPSPTDIDPPPTARPQQAADVDDPAEMSEAVATDVQSMPSVMTSVGQAVSTATRPARGDAGRYLVVPERIALQADTSFTTPRPEPPGPPASAAPRVAAGTRPLTANTPTTRRDGQPRPPAVRGQQQPQRSSVPPVAPRDQKQAAVPQRSWGGMFPNVAAGLEAMSGSWQRSRPTTQQAAPAAKQ